MEGMEIARLNWEGLGTIAALLFIIANAYYPARVIAKNYTPWSKEVGMFFRNYLKVHILLNLLGLWAVLFHGHFSDENNIILQASIMVTVWLTTIGAFMYYRVPVLKIGHLRMLHSQQVTFFVWIALILIGHSML